MINQESKKFPVTAIIPVRNEAANLPRCLSALDQFQEVLVVDSDSADDTVGVAKKYGAIVINFKWDGRYPKKRNWVLQTYQFKTNWVLFLDADEIVNDIFVRELNIAISKTKHNGFWLRYNSYFAGRRLRYGVPQIKLALIRVGKGLYEQINENAWSKLDMEVHEHPIIEGTVGEIAARIDHMDDRGIEKFIERHSEYAIWESRRFAVLTEQGAEAWSRLTTRQRFKYRNLQKWWYAWSYFCYAYFVKFGILDGEAGFLYAYYKSWYFETIRLICLENKRERG